MRLATLPGGSNPRDDSKRLALAQRALEAKKYAVAVRLWDEVLKRGPKLADDRRARHRYNAARAAALAATGKDADEPKPNEAARARLRGQALGWLKAELDVWSKALDSGDPNARAEVAPTLRHWQQDPDLAGVRGEAAIARLPEAERADWKAIWDRVAELLKKSSPLHHDPRAGP